MSTSPELQTLLERIRSFNRARDWEKYHSPKNLAMGLMIEAAELAEHFLWLESEESRELPPEKVEQVRNEIGDVLIMRRGRRPAFHRCAAIRSDTFLSATP